VGEVTGQKKVHGGKEWRGASGEKRKKDNAKTVRIRREKESKEGRGRKTPLSEDERVGFSFDQVGRMPERRRKLVETGGDGLDDGVVVFECPDECTPETTGSTEIAVSHFQPDGGGIVCKSRLRDACRWGGGVEQNWRSHVRRFLRLGAEVGCLQGLG
jgi:hypothetical protein